ncbi:TPA: hypothetical protein ACX6RJ_002067 [Photobacterium damselae]
MKIANARPQQTRERGINECIKELKKRGAETELIKVGNKLIIETFFNMNEPKIILVRSKSTNSWQTTIDYGKKLTSNEQKNEFWIFVDLMVLKPKFYIVPSWWIKNDIYAHHQEYLARYNGFRKLSNNSKHHAIEVFRVKEWEGRWDLIE